MGMHEDCSSCSSLQLQGCTSTEGESICMAVNQVSVAIANPVLMLKINQMAVSFTSKTQGLTISSVFAQTFRPLHADFSREAGKCFEHMIPPGKERRRSMQYKMKTSCCFCFVSIPCRFLYDRASCNNGSIVLFVDRLCVST